MLHMSGYVLFGGIVGLALGEWAGVSSRSIRLLWVGIVVIIAAANLVGLGGDVKSRDDREKGKIRDKSNGMPERLLRHLCVGIEID